MRVGLTIGTVYCGVPTVADDLLYLSRSIIELQAMLITQGYFAGLERFIISDTKTKVFIVNNPLDTDTWNQAGIFSINGKLIEVVEECTHLEIKRDSVSNSGHSTTVDDRIKSARGCAYSLMGTGLHGENGGNPRVSLSFWNTYVLPRLALTYGLDVLTLSKSGIQKLNQFHKKISSRSCISTREQLTPHPGSGSDRTIASIRQITALVMLYIGQLGTCYIDYSFTP